MHDWSLETARAVRMRSVEPGRTATRQSDVTKTSRLDPRDRGRPWPCPRGRARGRGVAARSENVRKNRELRADPRETGRLTVDRDHDYIAFSMFSFYERQHERRSRAPCVPRTHPASRHPAHTAARRALRPVCSRRLIYMRKMVVQKEQGSRALNIHVRQELRRWSRAVTLSRVPHVRVPCCHPRVKTECNTHSATPPHSATRACTTHAPMH